MEPDSIRCQRLVVGDLETNSYVVYSTESRDCFIIDPGAEAPVIIGFIESGKWLPAGIILTHGHFDHCGGVRDLVDRFKIPLMIHEADQKLLSAAANWEFGHLLNLSPPPRPDRLLREAEEIKKGPVAFKVLHTPGHTPGSIGLSIHSWLFSGDTLFQGDVGRTDLPGGSSLELQRSLARLKSLPVDTLVFPGHGDPTTIEDEIKDNPYL